MTTKDYKILAGVLNRAREGVENPAVQAGITRVYWSLVDALKQDNPRFSEEKFAKAAPAPEVGGPYLRVKS